MAVAHTDSLTKIVSYLSKVSTNPITFDGETYSVPKKFIVSATFFRRFVCPADCGGCCYRFTLDYFDANDGPEKKVERTLTVNDKTIPVWTYHQEPSEEEHHCDFVNKDNGRCGIHTVNPFSCKMEPIKLFDMKHSVYLSKRPFGRGWAMRKVDNSKGVLCEFHEDNIDVDFDSDLRILNQLNGIALSLELETVLPKAIEYVKTIQERWNNKEITKVENFLLWDQENGYYDFKKKASVKSLF